jgi:hypothetical protein
MPAEEAHHVRVVRRVRVAADRALPLWPGHERAIEQDRLAVVARQLDALSPFVGDGEAEVGGLVWCAGDVAHRLQHGLAVGLHHLGAMIHDPDDLAVHRRDCGVKLVVLAHGILRLGPERDVALDETELQPIADEVVIDGGPRGFEIDRAALSR